MFFVSKMIPELPRLAIEVHVSVTEVRGDTMPSAFAFWVGQSVILQVAADELLVPLRGVIVGESESTVRFQAEEGGDIDIYKHLILAIEQGNRAGVMVN
jgi:hypothetical protein